MTKKYERLGVIPVDKVLKAIADGGPLEHEGEVCHTAGNRLLTSLVHGIRCCVPGCAAHGQYFAVEKALNQRGAKYHLNLYCSQNGQEVMLTSDHKLPKSRGGSNRIENRQTMCYKHNAEKGNQLKYL
jgi:5-methylcytosine-specific restriction endonuclease McrA